MSAHVHIDAVRRPLLRRGRRRHPETVSFAGALTLPLVMPVAAFSVLVGFLAAIFGRIRPLWLAAMLVAVAGAVVASLLSLADPTAIPSLGRWTDATP